MLFAIAGVDDPTLPRPRKTPARFEEGSAFSYSFPKTPKDSFKHLYFSVIDSSIGCIESRFDQDMGHYATLCEVLIHAGKGEDFEGALKDVEVSGIYGDDINFDELRAQLLLLPSLACDGSNLLEFTKWFRNCGEARSLLPAIENLLALILTLPATNAVSERSFSGLRRVKTYLRSSMLQLRLNNVMICHVHKDICDKLDNKCIVKEFVESKPNRALLFNA